MTEQALLTEAALTPWASGCSGPPCDVRERLEVEGSSTESKQQLGGVHFLINNAGIANDGALWRL